LQHILYDVSLHNYNQTAWNDLLSNMARRFESDWRNIKDGENMNDYGCPEPMYMKTELEIELKRESRSYQLAI